MKNFTISCLVALCGFVLSAPSPENELEIRSAANECTSVTVIISILSQYKASATSFCSSFLSIPVKTVTPTNVVTSTSITSVIQTKTISPSVPITATTTVTPTVAPVLNPPIPELVARDDSNIQKRSAPLIPTYLTAIPPSKISSACSCLSITPSTTTIKATSTVIILSIVTAKRTVTEPPVTTTVADVIITASTTLTECAQAGPTFLVKLASSVIINGTQLLDTYGLTRRDYEDEGIPIDRLSFNGYTAPTVDGVLVSTNFPGVSGFLEGFESGFLAVRLGNETGVKALHFEDPRLFDNIDTPDLCVINNGGYLTCTRPDGATIWQLCPETNGFNDLFIGPTVGTGCSEVGITAIPLCTPAPAS